MLDPKVFKAYDVRGVYQDELDEEGAYAIGRAYVEHFEPRSIAVGRDTRLSSPSMSAALIEGAADGGADVLDLGLVGTEMVYYAVGELELEGGVCVTASHNPKQYTGMKIVRRGALPVGGESGLLDVRDRALKPFGPPSRRGEVHAEGHLAGVRRESALLRRRRGDQAAESGDRRRERDGGRDVAAGARAAPDRGRPLLLRAGRVVPEPRAESAPAREPRVHHPEDAWRSAPTSGSPTTATPTAASSSTTPATSSPATSSQPCSRSRSSRKEGGGSVIYDVRASRAVPETIERAGGVPLINRVGHAYIKHRMRKDDAVFGGEVSAHYYFRDFSQADSGVVPFLLLLELISVRGQKLSEILAPYRERFFLTGEINTPVADVPLKLQELKERYADGRVTHLDGISVDYDDWHFNVRPSNTEPLLRLNLEAMSEQLMEEKRDEVLDLIRS